MLPIDCLQHVCCIPIFLHISGFYSALTGDVDITRDVDDEEIEDDKAKIVDKSVDDIEDESWRQFPCSGM
jgi:hypothetical protein